MRQRARTFLGAAVVGAVFLAGLIIHGTVGAVLLLLVDAVLITLAAATWSRVRPQGRPLRLAIITVIAVIAIAKLASA
jgi:hypothetical protein